MSSPIIKLALPKGRIFKGVSRLFEEAGIDFKTSERSYRPSLSIPGWDTKVLKPRSVATMIGVGSRDVGLTGQDWIEELGIRAVKVLSTGLDPVSVVAAAPRPLLESGKLPTRPLVFATEYPNLTQRWLASRSGQDSVVCTFGATEVYPPEDADAIVDNRSSGSTLMANGLEVVDELMQSCTCLFASPAAMDDPTRRDRIEDLARLLKAVLDARKRVVIELNIRDPQNLDALVKLIPCMDQPTVAALHDAPGFAVKAAILRHDLPDLIPRLLQAGGSDILVSKADQIVVGGRS